MKGLTRGNLIAAMAMLSWSVLGQIGSIPNEQTNSPDSDQPGPVIAVSPISLDFGLVGAGRSKQLTLTVRNTGSGMLSGAATVAAPFSLSASTYVLQSGQSQTISVRYQPTAEGTNIGSVLFSGGNGATVRITGHARTPPRPPGKPRVVHKASSHFNEEDQADFVVRYYSDSTSYILKPAVMDGPYRSICDRALVLKVAERQPRHELAVVVLIHYPALALEEPVKRAWAKDLKALGYQRVVFLRAVKKMKVKGLKVLPDPQEPAMPPGN